MTSHEALRAACEGITTDVAKRLGVSRDLIYKWIKPTGDWSRSGAYNPADRLEAMIETALAKGKGEAAFEPIRYLAERFGYVCVRIPDRPVGHPEVTRSLLNTVKECGELVGATERSLENGKITKAEARAIETEGTDLVRQAMHLIEIVREAAR